jgi:hypothetical protein
MTNLCDQTYSETRCLHSVVDRHQFVKSIKLNSSEAKHYINTVEFVLLILEKHMDSESEIHNRIRRLPPHKACCVPSGVPLFEKIQRDTSDDVLYLSQVYLWYLSLMAGGSILRREYGPEYQYLFSFTKEDRMFLKSEVNRLSDSQHAKFISNVSHTYKLIAEYFNNFYDNQN